MNHLKFSNVRYCKWICTEEKLKFDVPIASCALVFVQKSKAGPANSIKFIRAKKLVWKYGGWCTQRSDDIKIQNGLPSSNSLICSCSFARVCVHVQQDLFARFMCTVLFFFFRAAVVFVDDSHLLLFLHAHFCVYAMHCVHCTWICTFYCHFVTHGKAFISNNALIWVNLWTVSRKRHIRFGWYGVDVDDAC